MTTDYLGEVAQQRDEFRQAADRFEQALGGFLRLGVERDVMPCLRSLFETYEQLSHEDPDRVEEGVDHLLAVADQTGADGLKSVLKEIREELAVE
jgi:hypothetical protein